MLNALTIASRKSALALWQSEHIKALLQEEYSLSIDILKTQTKGDKILDTPLALIGGKGLFTKEIEEILQRGEAQLAVHSLKDMPTSRAEGLVLAAVSAREDVRDAFLSETYASLDALPQNAVVGTTSLRRAMQLKIYRSDLQIVSLRGNVQTRLGKLKNKEFDAIILAYAGVKRLELLDAVAFVVPIDTTIMTPAMGQGALGIEARDEDEIKRTLSILNDDITFRQTHIERSFVHTLNGGCQAPIGVYCYAKEGQYFLDAIVGVSDGSAHIKRSICVDLDEWESIGIALAKEMIGEGALELIEKTKELTHANGAG